MLLATALPLSSHSFEFVRLLSHWSRWRGAAPMAAWLLAGLATAALPASAKIEFEDVTAAVGLEFYNAYGPVFLEEEIEDVPCPREAINMQRNIGNGGAVGDYDGDGDLDVYLVANWGTANKLFRNNLVNQEGESSKTFTDVTQSAFGLSAEQTHDLGLSRIAHLVDLDNDGDLDLFVLNDDDVQIGAEDPMYGPSRVFRNNGDGTFSDATTGSGMRPHGYLHAGAAIADYDSDGYLDIYTTVWTGRGLASDGGSVYPGQNQLFRNLGDFTFEEVTFEAGLGNLTLSSFTPVFHDWDDDGDVDLYVAIDGEQEVFYINEDGFFTDKVARTGVDHLASDMGIAVADYDNDDDLDFYVTNVSYAMDATDNQGNPLWRGTLSDSSRLTFEDIGPLEFITDTYWGWGTEWVDLENDGDLDIVAVNGFAEQSAYCTERNGGDRFDLYYYFRPTVLFESDDGGFVRNRDTDLEQFPEDSRGLIAFDYDRDGDRDLLITNTTQYDGSDESTIVEQSVQLFENKSSPANNYLTLMLEPDRCAIGATVRASFGDGEFRRRDVIAGDSYLVGTPAEVHFGLGGETSVAELGVEWADGRTDTLTNVAANQTLRVSCLPEPGRAVLALATSLVLAMLRTRNRWELSGARTARGTATS